MTRHPEAIRSIGEGSRRSVGSHATLACQTTTTLLLGFEEYT